MTQEEIQERNKQIALMLGLKPLSKPYDGAFTSDDKTYNSFRIFFNGLLEDESWYEYPKFHSDWNWLMEAVDFVEEKLKLETVMSNMGFGVNNQYMNINRRVSIVNQTLDNPSKIMGKASTKKRSCLYSCI